MQDWDQNDPRKESPLYLNRQSVSREKVGQSLPNCDVRVASVDPSISDIMLRRVFAHLWELSATDTPYTSLLFPCTNRINFSVAVWDSLIQLEHISAELNLRFSILGG
jgi:hypothetical protein